jgi:hypothetical protein
MPLLSLESDAMLCRADSRGRLGLLFRRRVGPLLFRAGGREPYLLPLFPGRLTALLRRPPWLLVKASSFVLCVPPLPRFIVEGRLVTWLGR